MSKGTIYSALVRLQRQRISNVMDRIFDQAAEEPE